MKEGASTSLCVLSGDSESLPRQHGSRVKIADYASSQSFQALTKLTQFEQNATLNESFRLAGGLHPNYETLNAFASLQGEAGYDTECKKFKNIPWRSIHPRPDFCRLRIEKLRSYTDHPFDPAHK
jgi:hypothetical protein